MPRPATPERILRSAHELLDSEGADAVTMRRVAEAAGITAMAIYRHFPNRDALLKRLSDDSFNAEAANWKAHASSRDPLKRLMSIADSYLGYALTHPHLFDHAFSVRRDDARKYPEDFQAGLSPTFNVVVDAIKEGMSSGVLRKSDPHDVAMTVWAHQHGLVALYRAGRFSCDEARFRTFYRKSLGRLIDGIKG